MASFGTRKNVIGRSVYSLQLKSGARREKDGRRRLRNAYTANRNHLRPRNAMPSVNVAILEKERGIHSSHPVQTAVKETPIR